MLVAHDHASGSRGEIFIVISDLFVGGSENHIALIVPRLIGLGWTVTVFSLFGEGPVAERLRQAGAQVLCPARALRREDGRAARCLRVPGIAAGLFAALRRHRPAIVHFVLPAAYLIGAPVAILAGCRRLVMSRRSLNTYQTRFIRAAERILHRRMATVIANSDHVLDQLRAESVPDDRLALIYNGASFDDVTREGRSGQTLRVSMRIGPEALVMAVVANLIPYKGHRDLLEALALAKADLPAGWRLLVIGRDDGIGAALHDRAAALGIADHVRLLGGRDDVAALLTASDIAILPSHEEGFSNFILEGMSAGLPLIVTDAGGNAEAVVHGETGFVTPVRSPAALADAIRTLAADAGLRRRMGEAGRRRVSERFSLARCVAAYDELYGDLLASTAPARRVS